MAGDAQQEDHQQNNQEKDTHFYTISAAEKDSLVILSPHWEGIRTELGLETCVSLGTLSAESVSYLLSRGLRSVHHNLETSRRFFPSMCTTHDYEEDVRAVRDAKAAGAWVCCGGIFGIGETAQDRVDLAAYRTREGAIDRGALRLCELLQDYVNALDAELAVDLPPPPWGASGFSCLLPALSTWPAAF